MFKIEGVLAKRSERVRLWKKRFVTFQDGILVYKKANKEESRVHCRDYVDNVFYWSGIKHGFSVHLSRGRVLYLSASSEEEAARWHDTFETYLTLQRTTAEMMRLTAKKHLTPIQESAYEHMECV